MNEPSKTGIDDVRAGHVLAEDLCSGNGAVILAQGATLTESIIVRLRHMGVRAIAIREQNSPDPSGVAGSLAELDRRFKPHGDSPIMMEIRAAIAEGLCGERPPPLGQTADGNILVQEPPPTPDEAKASVLRERIMRMLRLQTLPESVLRVSRILDNPSSTAADVSREIARDPALASQVLKLINSGFCGLPGQISSISHAAALLGFNTLKTVIFSAYMNERIQGPLASLWTHSLACSRVAGLLSRTLGMDQPEEVSAAGLLHDIGKSVLFECAPKEFEHVAQTAEAQDLLWIDAERRVLGLTHAETASRLLKKWNLPEASVAAIACHHQPDRAGVHACRTALLHIADVLVRARGVGSGGDWHIPGLDPGALEIVGLSIEGIRPIVDRMELEVKSLL